ncbi:MAG: TraM recognition domain-containing protein [Eubacterium sp.]|nr:TraM recognition domain-containing protein [Eubacterium sp.]
MKLYDLSLSGITQNLAQIKALFKDTWETIPGNCDTLIYLGGNEQSTHKYISELLGKATIDKRTNGETRGRQGSSSRNYDVLGRELLTPDEARKFENEKCLIFIRGFDPIMDEKYKPMGHPAFSQTADGGAEPYVHTRCSNTIATKEYEILTPESLKYYEGLAEKGENVFIDKLSMDEMTILSEVGVQRKLMNNDEKEARAKMYEEVESSLEYVDPAAEEEIVVDMNKVMKEEQEADKKVDAKLMDNSKTNRKKRNGINKRNQQLKYPSEAFSDESRYNADRFEKDLADNKISVDSGTSDSGSNASGGNARVIHKNVGPEATLIGAKKSDEAAKNKESESERKRRIEEYNKLRTGDTLPEIIGNDTLVSRIGQWHYSEEQKAEMHMAFEVGMSSELILEFFYPDMPVVAMRKIINGYKNTDGKKRQNK